MKEEGLGILGFLVAEEWQQEGRGQHAGFSEPCVQGRETVMGGHGGVAMSSGGGGGAEGYAEKEVAIMIGRSVTLRKLESGAKCKSIEGNGSQVSHCHRSDLQTERGKTD